MEIGVDTGGTFTDLVARVNGQPDITLKVPSTPNDPSLAVIDGIARLLELTDTHPSEVTRVVHGTTVATNAVLERKGALTGLIATRGFRDVLEIGRMIRTALYDLELEPETPVFLAPGERRKEIGERIDANGAVIEALDETSAICAIDELANLGCQSIAVSLLFSFLNPVHELRVRELINGRHPNITVSLSHEVDPAFREYERTVVTAFDAYTKPVLSRYLRRMDDELKSNGVVSPLQVMQSRGGVGEANTAARRPVRLFLSGPAAGVIGGAQTGSEARLDDVITVDIGGTSCDIALIGGGKPRTRPEGRIDGYPVRVPMVDVNAIGAGGGSLAWIDAAGGLRVGPESAGADPGPACYGMGGEQPTVTDASLVLGYLNPAYFAGGGLNLDPDRAAHAIEQKIASRLGLSVQAAAQGIHRVVNAQMAEGMRLVSIRQGFDPRDFSLVPLGGGGPVHAIPLAEELDIRCIVVPRHPGVLSAAGLLSAPIEHEMAAGFPHDLDAVDLTVLRGVLDKLDMACAELMQNERVQRSRVSINYSADVCYIGQSHYLEVPVDLSEHDPLTAIYEAFVATHQQVFGYATQSRARLVNLRSVHRVDRDTIKALPPVSNAAPERSVSREVTVGEAGASVSADVFARDRLQAGQTITGPAIIEQSDTTTIVYLGWQAQVQANGDLKLQAIKS